MTRLAIISSHPIQYNAPFFKALNLNENISVKVFYTWEQSQRTVYDPGFGQQRVWDIPLLEGYEYEFVKNISLSPGSHHLFGIINRGLKKKVRQWEPDAILIYGWAFVSHLLAIKFFYKEIPILFRGDSTVLNESKNFRSFIKRIFLKWVYRSIDKALFVGHHNHEYFYSYGVPEDKLVFLPHAVDNERFQASTSLNEKEMFKLIQEKTHNKRVFLFAGKLEEVKNPFLLLEAFIKLSSPHAALVFIGEGKLKNEMMEKAGGIENIYFLPFQNQSEIPGAYRLGEVFMLPSYSETWGLSVNEAMACGLVPIISDKVGCEADLVEDGVNGYVFSSGNADELSDRMRQLMDPAILDSFKKQSEKKVANFSIPENVHRMESILLSLKKSTNQQ